MKLPRFHLVPYAALPEDFAETHDSVPVGIAPKLCDAPDALANAVPAILG